MFTADLISFGSFFAGLFKIPLNSYIQAKVKGRILGDVLAYLNIMVFVFILISAGIFALINKLSNNDSPFVFLIISILTFIASLVLIIRMPKTVEDENNKE